MRLLLACVVAGFAATGIPLFAQTSTAPYAFWTLAGRAGQAGATDGSASSARFNRPWGIAVDAQGNVYVSEATNHVVRKITPDGTVGTLAGHAGQFGSNDGLGPAARFAMTGPGPNASNPLNSIGPFGVAVDGAGSVFVADGNNHTLRRISPAGLVTTFSGTAGTIGVDDGPVANATYRIPVGMAIDANGNLFVADSYNHVIRRITPAGIVSTIAGFPGVAGTNDGGGASARFIHPVAVAVAPNGLVYVADSSNIIRRLTPPTSPGGVWDVTTIAGSAFTSGTVDATGADARFGSPPVVSPTGLGTISYPSYAPVISGGAFLGQSYKVGDLPGLAADAVGNVYVTDFSNNTIRRISATGVVTTIGGATINGAADGLGRDARFFRPCGIAVDVAGTLYIADCFNHTIRKAAIAVAPTIQAHSGSHTVAAGGNVTLSITAAGTPPPAIQWYFNGAPVNGATAPTLTLTNVQVTQAGTFTATLTNSAGTITTPVQVLTVTGAPVFTTQPASQTVIGGQSVTLSVFAAGSPAPTYQWFRNGVLIPGVFDPTLVLPNVQDEHVGDYHVVATNSFGTATSTTATIFASTGRLANLSIRTALAASDRLIVGFVVSGGSKPLLVRAIGPALRPFGVAAAMNDPEISLEVGGAQVAANDNWSSGTNVAQIATAATQVGAFALAPGSLDAAVFTNVTNNAATAQVSGRNNTGGVVLLELYDAGPASLARLVNVSTRARVGLGEDALFAGFAIGGNSSRTLLMRAVGPTLGMFGVGGVLADPQLDVFVAGGGGAARGSNDNWNGQPTLSAAFTRVGAFPLPNPTSRDAALMVTLEPGTYTARVTGVGNTVGEVLLEIYELP